MNITLVTGDLPESWYRSAIKSPSVGCDIETSGLDKSIDKIAMFQLYVPNVGTVMIRKLSEHPLRLIRLLQHKKVRKIFHHAPFDLGFLMRDYHYLIPQRIADTKVAAKIFDPKREYYYDPVKQRGSHTLRALVYKEFDFLMNKDIALTDWFAENLTTEQIEYGAKDVEYLPELLQRIESRLFERGELHLAHSAYDCLPNKILLYLKTGSDIYDY